MFQEIAVMNPEFRLDNIEIVVNRTVLENLMKFIRNNSFQDFHLDLDMEGDTLFVGRKTRYAKGGNPEEAFSTGAGFEAMFATQDPELDDVDGHHRVINYMLGPLDICVRFEVDGYIADFEKDFELPEFTMPDYTPTSSADSTRTIEHRSPCSTVMILKGTLVSQTQIVKLKSKRKPDTPTEQMWFGRTLSCLLGTHRENLFSRLSLRHLEQEDLRVWEETHQPALQSLVWLLQKLVEATKSTKEGSAVLVAMNGAVVNKQSTVPANSGTQAKKVKSKPHTLVVYEARKRVGALPKEIVERFWTTTTQMTQEKSKI